ncbi:hypothetical protein DJ84_09755 [Halorubrum ezzemoulense]|nr:hypothetical protein DJ84_09755 [Halorubrum ezzemoulense]
MLHTLLRHCFVWNFSVPFHRQFPRFTHSKLGVPLSVGLLTISLQTGGPPYQIPKMLTPNWGWGVEQDASHSKLGVLTGFQTGIDSEI